MLDDILNRVSDNPMDKVPLCVVPSVPAARVARVDAHSLPERTDEVGGAEVHPHEAHPGQTVVLQAADVTKLLGRRG